MSLNYVDLSQLPRCSRGIDWRKIENVDVSFEYHGISDKLTIIRHVDCDYALISYKGIEYTTRKEYISNCKLGFLFNFSIKNNYKYEIGDIIPRTSGTLKICSKIRQGKKKSVKSYDVICIDCGSDFKIREGNLDKGDGCPICSNRKIKIGYNDIWTTNPKDCLFLTDKNDGYLYSANSNHLVDLTCPICNTHIGLRKIYDLTHNRVACKKCSDGISYPNKFLYYLLDQLNEVYETEVKFNWCKFPSFKNHNKFSIGKYDCYILNKNILVEMDSGLGHGKNSYSHSKISIEESIYRDLMKTKLAKANSINLIRINCEYYGTQNPFKACKEGILQSELSSIYDLSNIDWDIINLNCQSSKLVKACELYNQGSDYIEIADYLHISKYTAKDYLKRGSKLNLCEYKLYTRRKK